MRNVTAFVLAFALIAVSALGFSWYAQSAGMMWPDKLAESWKDVFELGIIFSAAIIGLVQLGLLLQQARDQHRQNAEENWKERARRTLEMDAKLTHKDFRDQRNVVQEVWKVDIPHCTPLSLEAIQQEFQKHKELETNLYHLLGTLDALSLPVCAKVADPRMAFELFSTTLVWYGIAFHNHIKAMQKTHAGWCSNLEALAPNWREKMEEEQDLKPFYVRGGIGDMNDDSPFPTRRGWSAWLLVPLWFLSLVLAGTIGAGIVWYLVHAVKQ